MRSLKKLEEAYSPAYLDRWLMELDERGADLRKEFEARAAQIRKECERLRVEKEYMQRCVSLLSTMRKAGRG